MTDQSTTSSALVDGAGIPAASIGAAETPPDPAIELLSAAHRGLAQIAGAGGPAERYRTAHVVALRAATAVLATRARPGRARRGPRGVWFLLPQVAPELAEWADYFRVVGPVLGTLPDGRTAVTTREADDLVRAAEGFCAAVERSLSTHAVA